MARSVKPNRQQLVAERAGKVADLIGVKIEDIRFDSNWISLNHEQMDLLFIALTDEGYLSAIKTLREEGEKSNQEPNRNITFWAVMVSAASFLEGRAGLPATEVCVCRCRQGKHCGGCGHDGCGYEAAS